MVLPKTAYPFQPSVGEGKRRSGAGALMSYPGTRYDDLATKDDSRSCRLKPGATVPNLA